MGVPVTVRVVWNKFSLKWLYLCFSIFKHTYTAYINFPFSKAHLKSSTMSQTPHIFIPPRNRHIKPYYLTPSSRQVCLPLFQRPIIHPLLPSLFICITKSSRLSPSVGIKNTGSKKGESREERAGLTKWNSIWQQQRTSVRPLISWLHSFSTLLSSWHDRIVYLALLWGQWEIEARCLVRLQTTYHIFDRMVALVSVPFCSPLFFKSG